MPRIVRRNNKPDRSVFRLFYQRLQIWWGLRYLSEEAYVVGMHVLQRMAQHEVTEVVMTWGEFAGQVIVRGDIAISGPTDGVRMNFIGALQELQQYVGLFNNVSQEGLTKDIEEAKENNGTCGHFTSTPGEYSEDVLGVDTMIIFRFVWQYGYSHWKRWDALVEPSAINVMPEWVFDDQRKRG